MGARPTCRAVPYVVFCLHASEVIMDHDEFAAKIKETHRPSRSMMYGDEKVSLKMSAPRSIREIVKEKKTKEL